MCVCVCVCGGGGGGGGGAIYLSIPKLQWLHSWSLGMGE